MKHPESLPNSARLLSYGVLWSYGAQVLTVFLQFGYAAFVSRQVGDDGFGSYAIALSSTGLFTLFGTAGISQAVSRLQTDDVSAYRPLVTYALVLGVAVGIAQYLFAPAIASIWGDSDAVDPTRLLAVSASLSSLMAYTGSVLRRQRSFKRLAAITLGANFAGMLGGGFAVHLYASSSALVVSAISSQGVLVLLSVLSVRKYCLPSLSIRSDQTRYVKRMVPIAMIQYLSLSLPKMAVSRFVGVPYLGQWNRAEVMTSVPFIQLQAAIVPVLQPQLRHHHSQPLHAATVWTNLVLLAAWVTAPLAVVVGVVVPIVLPLLLGAEWELAASLGAVLALGGALQVPASLASVALESLGRFKQLWLVNVGVLTSQVFICVLIFWSESIWIGVASLCVVNAFFLGLSCIALAHLKYLSMPRLLKQLGLLVIWCSGSGSLLLGLASFVDLVDGRSVVWLAVSFTLFAITKVASRTWVPGLTVARELGLLTGGSAEPSVKATRG